MTPSAFFINFFNAIRGFLHWATYRNARAHLLIVLVSALSSLVARNPTRSRERILSASEIPIMWAAFDEAEPMAGTALKLILLLGQRPGEVSHMRYEHIKDGWWEMPGEPKAGWPGTKNGSAHRVSIAKAAKALIAELESDKYLGRPSFSGDSGYVLTSTRGAVRDLDGAMRNICRKLVIERATPHDLRRTFGSTVTALGFGRDAMDRLMNHKSKSISSVYDRHGYGPEDQRIMETVASHIMGLVCAPAGRVVVRAFTPGR